MLGVYDTSNTDTTVSLYGAFNSKKEAKSYKDHLANALADGDKVPFYIKRIKGIYPNENLIVDEPEAI